MIHELTDAAEHSNTVELVVECLPRAAFLDATQALAFSFGSWRIDMESPKAGQRSIFDPASPREMI